MAEEIEAEQRQIGVRLSDEEREFIRNYTGVDTMATAIRAMIRRAMADARKAVEP